MKQQPQPSEEELEKIRSTLRLGLNDRVLCNCGSRWLVGHIVGTAVFSDGDVLPYLVKTDNIPGLPSNTISVPEDKNDDVCIQEVCFDPCSQFHLVKAAAPLVQQSNRPKLRFAVGDKVRCRVQNNPNDDLEQWEMGQVTSIWPQLCMPGDYNTWVLGDVSGKYADAVPYQVDLMTGRWIYCHKDDHTLIRREGLQPVTRVRGMSKRIEVRKGEDGSKERIDHVTERRKVFVDEFSDSD
jgi:hypothetical protein